MIDNSNRDVPGHIDITDDKWHMITVVGHPTETGSGTTLYVDGRYAGITAVLFV